MNSEHKKKGTILIIDDDILSCRFLKRALNSEGYEVIYSLNGTDGLIQLQKYKVDLILLDNEMPSLNGEQVLIEIRSNPAYQFLPILMITVNNQEEHVVKMLALGANDYLIKPIRLPILAARINGFLKVVSKIEADQIKQELQTIKAIIATYNHEINNPLTSALGFINIEMDKFKTPNENLVQVHKSIVEIKNTIQKIQKLSSELI